jgi:hypothetical protein
MTDPIINSEVHLPQGEEMKAARVTGRSTDEKGEINGKYNANPILNTLTYDVEFPNGEIKEDGANIIAENMLSQIDHNGHFSTKLDSILAYKRTDKDISKADKYYVTKSGRKHLHKTTDGYRLQVQWQDGPMDVSRKAKRIQPCQGC